MALYIPRSIFHLARFLYVRPETFGSSCVCVYIYIYKIYFTLSRCYMFRLVAILKNPTAKYLPKEGNRPKHVAAKLGEIYVSIISAFVGTKECNHSNERRE